MYPAVSSEPPSGVTPPPKIICGAKTCPVPSRDAAVRSDRGRWTRWHTQLDGSERGVRLRWGHFWNGYLAWVGCRQAGRINSPPLWALLSLAMLDFDFAKWHCWGCHVKHHRVGRGRGRARNRVGANCGLLRPRRSAHGGSILAWQHQWTQLISRDASTLNPHALVRAPAQEGTLENKTMAGIQAGIGATIAIAHCLRGAVPSLTFQSYGAPWPA